MLENTIKKTINYFNNVFPDMLSKLIVAVIIILLGFIKILDKALPKYSKLFCMK